MEILLWILGVVVLMYVLYTVVRETGSPNEEEIVYRETEPKEDSAEELSGILWPEPPDLPTDKEKEAKVPKKTGRVVYHVVPRSKGGWQVEKEGAKKPVSSYVKKVDAIAAGKRLAKSHELGQLKIHKKDGKFQTEYTYGADPRKSKG